MTMYIIWKFPFTGGPGDTIHLEIPRNARLLDVQLQDATPTLWALVDPYADKEVRVFTVLGTGWQLPVELNPSTLVHLATFQQRGFVWHVFEVVEPR